MVFQLIETEFECTYQQSHPFSPPYDYCRIGDTSMISIRRKCLLV
jgi:hypothetical protein